MLLSDCRGNQITSIILLGVVAAVVMVGASPRQNLRQGTRTENRRLLGTVVGLLAFYLMKDRRRIAQINIGIAFPELSDHARAELLKEHFKSNGCCGLVELGTFWWMYGTRVVQGQEMAVPESAHD